MIVHKIYNLDELKKILSYFKNNNYAYISYIIGEYGIVNSIYKIITYNFYLKMKEMGIKTVAFVLKGMKQFAYNCCDEIIEYQDIEINDNTNEIGIFSNNGYYGNDGTAKEYIFGMRSKNYEFILKSMSFSNLFYTLHCDGTHLYNNFSTYDETYTIINPENDYMIYYKINDINIIIEPRIISYQKYYKYKQPEIKKNFNEKTRNIAIYIRNTNKHTFRNTLKETYETVFNYCINNKIFCNVFLDLIPIKLPENKYIINKTDRFKNRPNWDTIIDIINNCDFYIGSDSGASEFIASNCNINCLFDRDIHTKYHNYLYEIKNKKKEEGFICECINFPQEFNKILDNYYNKLII